MNRVLTVLPAASLAPLGSFSVEVLGEQLAIPRRIYNAELSDRTLAAMDATERTVAHCLFTRHHDGYVRQRNLESAVGSSIDWVVPYVVALIGEYVIEIVQTILDRLDLGTPNSTDRRRYGAFIVANPGFFATTARRVTSYWNCYYRLDYPAVDPRDGRFPRYPGFALIDELRAAAAEAFEARR